jgi:hypothetical protein
MSDDRVAELERQLAVSQEQIDRLLSALAEAYVQLLDATDTQHTK